MAAEPVGERERASWLGFNCAAGIGPRKVRRLLDRFGSLTAAWDAPWHELARAGLDRRSIESLQALRRRFDPLRELERVRAAGARVLTWQDAEYPARLAAIPDPPPVLYVRGAFGSGDDLALAVVGTRRPTVYGRGVAEQLTAELASLGVTIISGLAKGIDSHAHRGALAGGGRTIAVLGHGIDFVYPPENRQLAERIVEQGAVVSDYPLGTRPSGENFPPRNRIISGLSAGVLIVEAPEGSGALITANYAADQGRDVFVVPGPITSPASRGCNRLIQEGAKLVSCAADILDELPPAGLEQASKQLTFSLASADGRNGDPPVGEGNTAVDRRLLAYLAEAGVATHVDDIARETGVPIHEVSAALTVLELLGSVRHQGGMRYAMARAGR